MTTDEDTTDRNIDVEADAVHESKSLHFLEMAVELNQRVVEQCQQTAEIQQLSTEMFQRSTEQCQQTRDMLHQMLEITKSQNETIAALTKRLNAIEDRHSLGFEPTGDWDPARDREDDEDDFLAG